MIRTIRLMVRPTAFQAVAYRFESGMVYRASMGYWLAHDPLKVEKAVRFRLLVPRRIWFVSVRRYGVNPSSRRSFGKVLTKFRPAAHPRII